MTQPDQRAKHSSDEMQLLNVQVFFRHGARTPLRFFEGIEEVSYDEDIHGAPVPHAEVPFEVRDIDTGEERSHSKLDEVALGRLYKGGMRAARLTKLGKEQAFDLGQRLNKRYIEQLALICGQFDPKDVYVRSSNVDRTIESMQCLIGGMFGVDYFKEHGPLIVYSKHYTKEDLHPNTKNCRALQQLGQADNMVRGLTNTPQYNDTMVKVQKIIGTDKFLDLVMLYDHVITRKAHGLRLEPWMEDMADDICKAAVTGIHYYIGGDKSHWQTIRPLAIGPAYRLIENNMKAAIKKDNSTEKFHLYACHDTSVFALMMTLGDPMDHWPPYATDIRYELYEDKMGKHWVQIMFCDKEYTPVGCDNPMIPLSKFQEIIKYANVSPEEYKHICSDLEVAKAFARKLVLDSTGKEAETGE